MPEPDLISFASCADFDAFFREGRPYFNEIYVKKLATLSTYFKRIPQALWPLYSNTTQTGFRFGRGWYDPCTPWKKVISDRCTQNSCESQPQLIMRPGTDSYTFDLLKRELMTEWICVADLLHRQFPVEEVMQIEESNAVITKHIHEEFGRSQYIGAAAHKWAGIADADNEFCGLVDDNMFYVEQYSLDNEAGYDLCHIRVKMAAADLANISYLSLDMLEDALIGLSQEDDAYRPDLMEASGMPLLDIIIPDGRVARNMYFQAKKSSGNWDADTDWTDKMAMLRLGINRVIGDFAFGWDIDAAKFNADTAFNATLGAFNENDPDTWPRLIRVPRYIKVAAEIGCKYIPNKDHPNADFAISVAFVENAMLKYTQPSLTGFGSVQMEAQNYAGDFEWRRPDWECNRWGKSGYFQAQLQAAMQIKDPTIMNVFLHRMPKRRQLQGACCPLNTYVPPVDTLDCWVCTPVGG